MVALLKFDYNTRYGEFTYDSWDLDGAKLPTMNTSGSAELANITSACMGSIAIGTDGSYKVLHGDTNKWISYIGEV